MSKEMVVSANAHETRVAILEEGQLCEIYVEREKEFALVGSIYKGRVTRVLPGMQSAFVDIGLDSDAFLYVSDFLQEIEEMDKGADDHASQALNSNEELDRASAAPAITALPGETISTEGNLEIDAGNSAEQPRDSYVNPPVSREGGRRDFRRGDRQGGDRGRGGRGRHGHGGRERSSAPFGRRELPQSKYASHRPYEPPDEGIPNQPFEGVVLPGESLSVAKHASMGQSSALDHKPEEQFEQQAQATAEEALSLNETPSPEDQPQTPAAENTEGAENPTQIESAENGELNLPATEPQQRSSHYPPRFSRSGRSHDRRRGYGSANAGRDRRPGHHGNFRREDDDFQQQGWATSLEPLPGESLAKAKAHETEAESKSLTALEAQKQDANQFEESREFEQPEGSADPVWAPRPDLTDASSSEASVGAREPELTEEEATNLAEQVAEAQQEEAEREAVERVSSGSTFDYSNGSSEEGESDEDAAEVSQAAPLEEERSSEEFSNDVPHEGDPLPQITETEAEVIGGKEGEEAIHEEIETASAGAEEVQFQPSEARVRSDFRARMQRPMRRGGHDRGRGRRPFYGHMRHRGQPRRNQLISELLKAGQEIIVQIAKEPLGKKGARITSHIALPGRFLVYMPTLDHTGVSRKIASAEERSRLRHLVNDAKGSAGGGFIVRTAAASASPDEVREDVQFLTKTWSDIKGHSEQRKAASLLHRDLNLVERILRDYLSADYSAIWVDSEEEYTKILEFVSRFQPQLANRVKLFTKSAPIFEEFGIQQEIDKGLRPKVWLKSGGYIVINHTEALVAIDVNTGKFVGRGSNRLEDTIVRTNIEAVKEIVRQIRLRDLGGIIIIDFIDMEERRNRDKVMAALEEALKSDRAPSKVLRFNEFGLVAITRKRTKQALERTLCQPCPYCTGSGMVKSIPTLCYEIQSEARKMSPEIDSASLTLRVHPEIAKALKTRESALMDELEQATHKSLIIQADPTLHWEQYDIY